jgi:hypothetical protein
MALLTYQSQVDFIKRWMSEGHCERVGTWQNGSHSGDMWMGSHVGYHIHFKTLGRMLQVGSFRVSIAATKVTTESNNAKY